jgi:hypothetical protein
MVGFAAGTRTGLAAARALAAEDAAAFSAPRRCSSDKAGYLRLCTYPDIRQNISRLGA